MNMLRILRILCALGGGMLAVFAAMARIPSASQALGLYVGLYSAAFVLYLAAAAIALRSTDRQTLAAVIVFALIFRLALLPVRPTISTDIYRYIWDGRVSTAGINPYKYCPNSPRLAHLRNANWNRVSYRGTNTPYPPTSQIIFFANYKLFGESVLALKAFFVLCDLLLILLILLVLRALRLPGGSVILYAWSPLIVTEFAGAGHQDIVGVMLLFASLCAVFRRRGVLSGLLIGASCLIKPYPIPAIPVVVRVGGGRAMIAAAAIALLLYTPFLSANQNLFLGSLAYLGNWYRNGSIFPLLDSGLSLITAQHQMAAKLLSLVCLVGISLRLAARKEPERVFQSVFTVLAAVFLLSPTVYPWYLTWTAPFLCFLVPVAYGSSSSASFDRLRMAELRAVDFSAIGIGSRSWLLLTGTVGLSYLLPLYGWPAWLQVVEYGPPLILAAASILQARLRCWEPKAR
ncbi:MAG: DUF2029 domain-containing protein [Armatimonadetes bacterium]|nr:DUF2029 domain-containing protein [Armatimonadota bacterium]